jgi:ABC-type bacteriocin/lantibiotic exporter with double-glycine peptidase domain
LLLPALIVVGIVETLGIASITPFLALVAQPQAPQDMHPVLRSLYDGIGFSNGNSFLIFLGSMAMVAIVLSNAFSAFVVYLIHRFGLLQNHRLQARLFERYLTQPYAKFATRNTSELGKNIAIEVGEVVDHVLFPILHGTSRLFAILAIIGLLVAIDPVLAATVSAALGGLYAGMYVVIQRRLQRHGKERARVEQVRHQVVAEAFRGIKDVKSGGHERTVLEALVRPSLRHARISTALRVQSALPKYLLEVVAFGSILVIVIYMLASQGTLEGVLPTLGLYAFASYRLMPAVQVLYESATQLRFYGTAVDILAADLMPPMESALPPAVRPSPLPFEEGLELRDVSFRYEQGDRPSVSGLNLYIPAGSTVALVGPTGCGKSTTVDLILGLLTADTGQVLVDGQEMDAGGWRAWREGLGYVPQQIFLADTTIAKNIAFGVTTDEIDYGAVRHAAKVAQIHDFITSLPEGYETVAGDAGVRLSGGQRQRIGIARALYRDPHVLIFDEATSALDNKTEQDFYTALTEETAKKTVILVSHRLSTVRNCDMLFMLEHGKVIAQGTYDELEASNPRFRHFVAEADRGHVAAVASAS